MEPVSTRVERERFVDFLFRYSMDFINHHKLPVLADGDSRHIQTAQCVAIFKEPQGFSEFIDSRNLAAYVEMRRFMSARGTPFINMNHVKLLYKRRFCYTRRK